MVPGQKWVLGEEADTTPPLSQRVVWQWESFPASRAELPRWDLKLHISPGVPMTIAQKF